MDDNLKKRLQELAEYRDPSLKMQRILTDRSVAEAILKMAAVPGIRGEKGDLGLQGLQGIQGIQGIAGNNGKDGENGKNGYNPARGIDYWTIEDQQSIISSVVARLPTPKDGVSPSIEEIVKRATEEVRKIPVDFKDIKGIESLIQHLKMGGFRGGGLSDISGLILEGGGIIITGDGTVGSPYVISSSGGGGSVVSVNGQTGVVVLTTSDIAEGSNLYYTTAHFNTTFATKTTTDLAEGSNLYYTAARFNTAFAAKTTSDLAEGSNLYFTTARAITALTGQNISIFTNDAGYITTNQTITLSGDVTGSGTTAITTVIGANKVTLAMMATIATGKLLGRSTAGTGNVEALTVSTGLTLSAGNLTANVQSVFGRTGAVVATSGDYTTAQVTESGNLYYTDARVRLNRLDQMATPTADVDWGGKKITNLLNPTGAQDAATKSYVDAIAAGLSLKTSVRLASAAALPTNVYNNGASGVGATLTGVSFGALTVDGVTVVVGDRILIKDEAAGANNGIYTVTVVGAVATVYQLTRATDNDTTGEFVGSFTFVSAGTVNASKGYVCTNSTAPTVGTTAITWTQFSSAGAGITSLNGLSGTSQTFAIGTSGTAPAFVSSGTTHTLNIPMASTAAVTAGLLSKADYDIFNAKPTITSGAANQVAVFSSATNISSSNSFSWNPSTFTLNITGGTASIQLNESAQTISHRVRDVGAGVDGGTTVSATGFDYTWSNTSSNFNNNMSLTGGNFDLTVAKTSNNSSNINLNPNDITFTASQSSNATTFGIVGSSDYIYGSSDIWTLKGFGMSKLTSFTPTSSAALSLWTNNAKNLGIYYDTGFTAFLDGQTTPLTADRTFAFQDTSGTFALLGNKLSAFAATTSAELAGVISDETGSGALVFATSPTLVTPILGVATATSINKVAITAPAASATLTLANTSSFITVGAFSETLTFTGTTNSTFPAGTDTLLGRASTDTITGKKTFSTSNTAATLGFSAGTAPGSPIEGDTWNDSTQKSIVSFVDGVKQISSTVLFTQTATATAVTNTITETSIVGTGIGTNATPAAFLTPGKVIRIKGFILYSSAAVPGTLTVRVRYGTSVISSTIIGTLTYTPTASITNQSLELDFWMTCRTTGVTGTVTHYYSNRINTAASTSYFINSSLTGTTTINTTAANTIFVTAQWGTAAAANSIAGVQMMTEVLN